MHNIVGRLKEQTGYSEFVIESLLVSLSDILRSDMELKDNSDIGFILLARDNKGKLKAKIKEDF